MKYYLTALTGILLSGITMAQSIKGTYSFRRQEMVAAFNFTEGNKFEFYYSYGASDRSATGTYTISGDTIKLSSDKEAGKDFTIKHESKKGSKYRIVVSGPNKHLVQHVVAIAFAGEEQQKFESDENGIINIDVKRSDKIYLKHELFPDFPTLIKDSTNTNNYFEVTLNPSLVQVSFKGIDLFIADDALTCHPNYFMLMENISFEKE